MLWTRVPWRAENFIYFSQGRVRVTLIAERTSVTTAVIATSISPFSIRGKGKCIDVATFKEPP